MLDKVTWYLVTNLSWPGGPPGSQHLADREPG